MLTSLFLAAVATAVAPKWTLTFSQEFDGPKGSAPDPKIWSRDLGGNGFGNHESQSYTDGNKNAFLDGKGNLIIEARKEPTTGKDGVAKEYSSARLKTDQSFSQTYGKFEARLKMPIGKGIWPAFWMLGANAGKVGWPKCGEIDIMEFLGHQANITHGTVHGPGYSGAAGVSSQTTSASALNNDFHVYGFEWEPEELRFYLDGKLFQTVTPNEIGTNDWVYDHPFFFILNLAVGGDWPGYPDANTTFPQQYVIDYVRAYKDENLKIDTEGIKARAEKRKKEGPKYNWPGPFQVPGTVPFAEYNVGGEGVAYHDVDPENQGGQGRTKEGVDVGNSGTGGFKTSVGWTKEGEWLNYDLDVQTDARFYTEFMVASDGDGGTMHIEIDGKVMGDPITIPNTGGWTSWKPVQGSAVFLSKGKHTMKLKMDKNGKSGSIGNLLSLKFTQV